MLPKYGCYIYLIVVSMRINEFYIHNLSWIIHTAINLDMHAGSLEFGRLTFTRGNRARYCSSPTG